VRGRGNLISFSLPLIVGAKLEFMNNMYIKQLDHLVLTVKNEVDPVFLDTGLGDNT
jgi:hypothetical protein